MTATFVLGAPGTKQAQENGCVCPVMDNHYGRGWGGDGATYGWVVNGDCRLHSVNYEQQTSSIADGNACSVQHT